MQVKGVGLVFGAGRYTVPPPFLGFVCLASLQPKWTWTRRLDSHWTTGSGIGRTVARTLVTQGLTTLVCADIDASRAQETASSSSALVAGQEGYEATAYGVDVRQEAQVQALVARVKDRYGRIDICVTTAGVSQPLQL